MVWYECVCVLMICTAIDVVDVQDVTHRNQHKNHLLMARSVGASLIWIYPTYYTNAIQGHVQDLKKGGAESIACKNFGHAPKCLLRPSLTRSWVT
jgi:hypothetical protein